MPIGRIEQIWPEWPVGAVLGSGSYGTVYKSVRRDQGFESCAAIKVISLPRDRSELDALRAEGVGQEGTRTYLKGVADDIVEEIKLLYALKGTPNIVSIEDYKVVEKTHEVGWNIYIRMELLTPLTEYVGNRRLSEAEVIKLGADICTALELCGRKHVIHRDIKPENIFVNDFGFFKLGDFGIARRLENVSGGLSQKGTFNYMAPEVMTSADYGAGADIYSLGIVLYKLLNGNRLPFLNSDAQLLSPGERRTAVERRLRGEPLPPPRDASPAMAAVILRACEFDPSRRFASAGDMKAALEGVAAGSYVGAADNMDGTVKVRRARDSDGETSTVRPASSERYPGPGNVREKKKSAAPKIAAALAVFLLAVIAAFTVPKLLDGSEDDGTTETAAPRETTVIPAAAAAEPEPVQLPTAEPEPDIPLGAALYTGSLSGYGRVWPSGVSASSVLEDNGVTYFAANAVDGSVYTSWQEAADGNGEGESLLLTLNAVSDICLLRFRLGYARDSESYYMNGRPHTVLVEFSDGSSVSYSFPDENAWYTIELSERVSTEWVRVTIGEVYTGTHYEDTCITEVELYGPVV